jgi:hypothetical protein
LIRNRRTTFEENCGRVCSEEATDRILNRNRRFGEPTPDEKVSFQEHPAEEIQNVMDRSSGGKVSFGLIFSINPNSTDHLDWIGFIELSGGGIRSEPVVCFH